MKTGAATPSTRPSAKSTRKDCATSWARGTQQRARAALRRPRRHGIDYMVIGAVALMAHGYPRFTEDIDLVMTRGRA